MTFDEARDAILKVFKDAWDATGFPVVWTDIAAVVPTTETVWARATIRHATARQASLAGAQSQKRWQRTGTVFIQVFAPIGDGSAAAYNAAQIVVNAYQSSQTSNVWFRNVRINEVGSDGAFEQLNVLADFNYDDVR